MKAPAMLEICIDRRSRSTSNLPEGGELGTFWWKIEMLGISELWPQWLTSLHWLESKPMCVPENNKVTLDTTISVFEALWGAVW